MTEDEYMELGEFIDNVLTHPHFNRLTKEFELAAFDQFASTKLADNKERERIFATFDGARTFLSFLADISRQRGRLLEAQAQSAQEPEDYSALDEPDDETF